MIHAHLVCAAVASGGGLDCAVVVDADRAAVWERVFDGAITITSELPFGAAQTASRAIATPPAPGGDRYAAATPFAAADFLPCAKTTVTAELIGDGGAIWRGSITLPTRGCARPRMKVRVRCDHAMQGTYPGCGAGVGPPGEEPSACLGGAPEGEMKPVIICTATVVPAPAVPLRLFGLGSTDGPGELADGITFTDDGGPFARIHLAITTADGAIVWRGAGR